MRFVIDMNLAPAWVETFRNAGWQAEHWSQIGDPSAADAVILAHARSVGAIVFTHALDFGRLLALTHADGPSVLQVRTSDVTPQAIGQLVVSALRQSTEALRIGALITIDASTRRTRILPLRE